MKINLETEQCLDLATNKPCKSTLDGPLVVRFITYEDDETDKRMYINALDVIGLLRFLGNSHRDTQLNNVVLNILSQLP